MNVASNLECPRILLKEFGRRRLPKRWNSLPSLQIAPGNRHFYICRGCKFPNLLCELCPWCLHSCDVAAPVKVIRRRVSSPALLNDKQKTQLAAIERRACDSDASMVMTTPSRPCATRDLPDGVSESEDEADIDNVRRRHRNAVLYSATDVVATATVDATLQPFLDQIAATHLENRERCRQKSVPSSITTTPPSVRSLTSTLSRSSRRSSPRTPPLKARTRMSMQCLDVIQTSEPKSVSHHQVSPPRPTLPHTPQMQGLRRKRRMSVLRQRSSCSLRRRATTSGAGAHCRDGAVSPSSPTSPKTPSSLSHKGRSPTSIRFSTPPPGPNMDTVPLGHPQRPLYTAIRKNMSRPESPTSSPTKVIDASFKTVVYERGTRSLDIDPATRFGSITRSSYFVAARPALFPSSNGFSVSGETELRMDLARSRSIDGVPSDFAFREVKPGASMKSKVKSFGKTLKGLLRIKI